jgi:hypothetical protein
LARDDWDLLRDYEADLGRRINEARDDQLSSLKDPGWKENDGVVNLEEIRRQQENVLVYCGSATALVQNFAQVVRGGYK